MVLGIAMTLQGLSVVLPALNEEKNVEQAILSARDAAMTVADACEVIVVDDGSTDDTADRARRAGARVVSHGDNRGYGAALRSGFQAAQQPWIFQMDCDNQFDPREIKKLVELAPDAQLVIGIRSDRADSWKRRAAGRAWNRLCRLTFGYLAQDIDCGFKLLNRDAVARLPLESNGACISVELCIAARAAGYRIRETPVGHYPRTTGTPTGLRPRVVLKGLRELYELRRRYGRYPRTK